VIDATPPLPAPEHFKLDSRTAMEQAVDRILALARHRIAIFGKTFGTEWNAQARVDLVRAFCLASRRNQIRIVLHDPHPMYRNCPRLLQLLRQFSHVISIHETQYHAKNVYDPFVLVDERHYLHRFHYDAPNGLLALEDPHAASTLRDRFEELWASSEQAIPATTLGL
jgi:hypothetical protein